MQKLKIVIVRCHDEQDEKKVIKLVYPNTIKSHTIIDLCKQLLHSEMVWWNNAVKN